MEIDLKGSEGDQFTFSLSGYSSKPFTAAFHHITVVVISHPEGSDPRVAIAQCNPTERKFDRSRGEKIALARAIAHLPKEARKAIWTEYLGAFTGSVPVPFTEAEFNKWCQLMWPGHGEAQLR